MALPIYSCFHPILKKKTEDVENLTPEIIKLAHDMVEAMHVADGIGLAANQVGQPHSIVTINTSIVSDAKVKYKDLIMINPVITDFSEEESDYKEGCLSVPTIHEVVVRPKGVVVQYYDLAGKEHTIEDDDIFARVIQHEYDHLQGIIFTERLSPIKKALIKSKMRKIQKGEILPDYQFVDQNDKVL